MSTLEIKDLYAHVETKDGIKPILKGVNLTVMIENASTHSAAASNLWEFITRHPQHRGLITRYLGAVNAPTERDTL